MFNIYEGRSIRYTVQHPEVTVETIIDIIRQIVALDGFISMPREGMIEIKGPKLLGPLAAKLLSRQKTDFDEIEAILRGGPQHAPTETLGRLSRNLLPWCRGRKIQVDDGVRQNVVGMAEQIYKELRSAPAGEPGEELAAMIMAFKAIVAMHEWRDAEGFGSAGGWPEQMCPPIVKGGPDDPNRNILELPPPGYVRGGPMVENKKSLYSKD
jgi:hypothetical protein